MRLNPMQMERLAGDEEFAAGKELEEAGSVRVSEQDSTMVRYTVAGKPPRTVTLGRSLVLHCDCDLFTRRGCCRHAVAAWLAAERAGIPEGMLKKNAPRNAAGLTDLILRQMPAEPNVHLEVTLVLPRSRGRRSGSESGRERINCMSRGISGRS